MHTVSRTALDPGQWDALCDGSRDAWLFHRECWIDIEATCFPAVECGLAVVERGEVLAVCPLYRHELGMGTWVERLLTSGMPRAGGPALRDELGRGTRRGVQSALMRGVLALAEEFDADRVELGAQTAAPAFVDSGMREVPFYVLHGGFHLGVQIGPQGLMPVPGMASCAADQVVDLEAADEDVLFEAFDPACRRAVRKAMRAGMDWEVDAGHTAVERYATLARQSAERSGQQLPPLDYYDALFRLGDAHCGAVFATLDGQTVAGVVLGIDKGTASFLAGASLPEQLALRVNDFVHWAAIRWCRATGLRHYRLGPSFPSLPADWPVSTVSRFKTKFGARSVPMIQACHYRHPERYLELGRSALASLCAPPDTCTGQRA